MSNANTVSLSNLTSKNFNPNINKVSAEKHYVTPDEFTSMNQEYEREELIAVDYENELSSEEWETRNSSVDDYVFTFTTSFAFGILEPVENVIDGLVMTGGEIASFCCEITGQEEPAEFIKQNTKNLVGYDWTEAGYDAVVNTLELDEEVAHGDLHQVGTMLGSITGYAAISLTFGGVGNAILGYLSAKGSSAENAFNSGATFEEAQVTSNVAGIVGAASGYGLNKIQQAATGTQSMKGVAGYTSLGAFVSTAEPVANSIAEYATYGHDLVDENGNPLYENFGDYYVNSGGLLNTGIAFGVGGISTGSKAASGYKVNNDIKSYKIKNLESFTASDINALLSDAQVSDYGIRWSKRQLEIWAHQNFDGVFGVSEINKMMDKINKVSDDYWPEFLKSRGLSETTLGFVDRNSDLYLPQSASEHSAFHELFHQLSEINGNTNGLKYTDANGNLRKITGIREFYADGLDSNLANESLTEYLSSKYTDGKIYNSIYDASNARSWERIDTAMKEVYGEAGSNMLLNSYITNDTSNLRNFFSTYSPNFSYDDFVRSMKPYYVKELDNIVSEIEKNCYKQNGSFGSRIRSLFGGK